MDAETLQYPTQIAKERASMKRAWVELPTSELFFAECYYIGAYRPERNREHGHKEIVE